MPKRAAETDLEGLQKRFRETEERIKKQSKLVDEKKAADAAAAEKAAVEAEKAAVEAEKAAVEAAAAEAGKIQSSASFGSASFSERASFVSASGEFVLMLCTVRSLQRRSPCGARLKRLRSKKKKAGRFFLALI